MKKVKLRDNNYFENNTFTKLCSTVTRLATHWKVQLLVGTSTINGHGKFFPTWNGKLGISSTSHRRKGVGNGGKVKLEAEGWMMVVVEGKGGTIAAATVASTKGCCEAS